MVCTGQKQKTPKLASTRKLRRPIVHLLAILNSAWSNYRSNIDNIRAAYLYVSLPEYYKKLDHLPHLATQHDANRSVNMCIRKNIDLDPSDPSERLVSK